MRIEFLKMQGLGNDFVVFDVPPAWASCIDSNALRALADRHTGIGFDQALLLDAPRKPGTRVFYRVFNADGGEVEQCGNGARCVAALHFARHPELGRDIVMESAGGTVQARVLEDGQVAVAMGVPNFAPASLPFDAGAEALLYTLEIGAERVEFSAVSLGNPHVVMRVPDAAAAPVRQLGPAIERHPRFPKRTNVGFMQIADRDRIKLRVFERGVGETRACGTGACAAVAAGVQLGLLNDTVRVELPGGTARVEWRGPGEPIWLTGPAVQVFNGSIDL